MAQDRISELPDPLIQHIISFLPSTKQAIRTGILSNRWRKQWAQVPVLIFDSSGMSRQNFIAFVDKTLILHECSKINTFHLHYDHLLGYKKDPYFDEKIRYATAKQVEDLTLSCAGRRGYNLPPEFFKINSLVKLTIRSCSLYPTGKVNWGHLKALNLDRCNLSHQGLGYVVSGSPLLESLVLTNCNGVNMHRCMLHKIYHNLGISITTESLKKLVFEDLCIVILEISCPNLEELSLKGLKTDDPELLGQVIENVLSNSLLLESLMVHNCPQLHLPVIDSQSLKRLVISNIDREVESFEMSCQKLEELTLLGFINVMNVNLGNVPSSLCATLDFYTHCSTEESRNSFFKDILQQLQHIKELTLRRSFFRGLRLSEASYPVLHIKCLILDSFHWIINLKTVACILRNCSILETLVVKLFFNDPYIGDVLKLGGFEENYWSSNAVGPSCLVSHLKNVKIYGIQKRDRKPTQILNFIQFLLKNARVLENMTVVLPETRHTDHTFEVSQELFGFTRCSEHVTVELISDRSLKYT